MHYSVSETPDAVPVYLRMFFFIWIRNSIGRLTDYFKVSDDCINCFWVFGEFLKSLTTGILQDFIATVNNILNQ